MFEDGDVSGLVAAWQEGLLGDDKVRLGCCWWHEHRVNVFQFLYPASVYTVHRMGFALSEQAGGVQRVLKS